MTIPSAFSTFFTDVARRVDLHDNSLVMLDNPGCVLLVEQDYVDLFAIRLEEGQPTGRWVPLGRALAGAVLVAPRRGPRHSIVGRTAPGAVLSYLPIGQLSVLSGRRPDPEEFTERAAGALSPAEIAAAVRELVRGIDAGIAAIAGTLLRDVPPGTFVPLRSTGELLSDGSLWSVLTTHEARLLNAVDRSVERREEAERSALLSHAAIQSDAVRVAARSFDAVVRTSNARVPLADVAADSPDLAAVRLVASAMGFSVRAPTVSERVGSKLDPVRQIALANGVRTRQIRLEGSWWKKDIGPLLGCRKTDGRVLALLPVRGAYMVADPAANRVTRLTKNFAAEFDDRGTVLYRPLPAGVHRPGALLRFAISGARGDMLRIGRTSLIVAAIGLLAPIMTGQVLGNFVARAQRSLIIEGALLVIGGAFVAAAISVVQNIAALRLEGSAAALLQSAIWSRLLSLPTSFFSQRSTGDLAVSALGVNAAQEVLSGIATIATLGLVTGSLNLVLVFYYDLRLALIAVGLLAVCAAVCSLAGYSEVRWQRRIYDNRRLLSSQVFQLLTGLSKIRVAAAEDRAFIKWSATFTRGRAFAVRARRVQNLLTTFNAVFPLVCSIVIFAMVAGPLKGKVPIAAFLSFNAAFILLTAAMLQFTAVVITSLSVVPLLERIKPILTQEPESTGSAASPGELRGQITLSHVCFRYGDDKPLVLDDVSFTVDPGEFVAIVGPTGCGKSTLLRLLLGFETATAGSVLFDGQGITQLEVGEVRRQCGVVLQNGELLAGDIKSNIIGATGYTSDDAWAAARMADVDEDIAAMPMGMNTVMSEGATTLSGGQRQRIMIARALLSRPRIILFDEATSALDNPTQAVVAERMRQLNASRIIIAHRLSSVAEADRIVVLDQGRVVQCGSYKELLADRDGLFASLASQQLT